MGALTQESSDRVLGRCLVVGAGRAGMSAVRLLSQLPASQVSSITVHPGATEPASAAADELARLGVELLAASDTVDAAPESFDLCVMSPGIAPASPLWRSARAASTELIGEPELAYRLSPERWLVITGTNGKTTTTSLTAHLLTEAGLPNRAVGNIGDPCCDHVLNRAQEEWFVAELSSFQLEEAFELHPQAAVLLNLTPDHIDWHGDLAHYAAAKERVFAQMGEGDLAVISVDDEPCCAIAQRVQQGGAVVCRLSLNGDPGSPSAAFCENNELVVRFNGTERLRFSISDPACLRGVHNHQNMLAAFALGLWAGASARALCEGMASFTAPPHRLESVLTHNNIEFINDSKATNTDSVEKALLAFRAGSIVVMLGGFDKGTDLASLAATVVERCRVAVCFGAAGPRFADALRACKTNELLIFEEAHLREAFARATAEARAGDVVLLSPGCSSFDEFSNMAERGKTFRELCYEWSERHLCG